MKKIFFLTLLIIGSFHLKSQTNTSPTSKLADLSVIPTNEQRYKVDYEIKEWITNPLVVGDIDKDKLKLLNLDYYDSKRKQTEDYEEFDATTGLTIIVYSIDKTNANQK